MQFSNMTNSELSFELMECSYILQWKNLSDSIKIFFACAASCTLHRTVLSADSEYCDCFVKLVKCRCLCYTSLKCRLMLGIWCFNCRETLKRNFWKNSNSNIL